MTPEQAEAHDKPVALLRPPPVRSRTTILQVLIAIVLNGLSVR